MEDLAKPSRLTLIKSTYYFRASVPLALIGTYGNGTQTEVKKSLRTKDYAEAKRLCCIESVAFDNECQRLNQPLLTKLPRETIAYLADLYYHHLLDEDDEARNEHAAGRLAGYDNVDDNAFNERTETLKGMRNSIQHDIARNNICTHIEFEVDDLLSWEGVGLHLEKYSSGWIALAKAIQEATLKGYKALLKRQKGKGIKTPLPPQKPHSTAPMTSNSNTSVGLLLSDAIKAWIKAKTKEGGGWTVAKTSNRNRAAMKQFIDLRGDRPLSDYNKDDGNDWYDLLMTLPANWMKKPQLRSLTVSAAKDEALRLQMKPMTASNAEHMLRFVKSFWSWAVKRYSDPSQGVHLYNPLDGIEIKQVRTTSRQEDHEPFTLEDLQRVFHAPLYTGCKSLERCLHTGEVIPNDTDRYWVPLLALFTGARAGELLQLYLVDVREENGVDYFSLNTDHPDKKLKNKHSCRNIPIHPQLKALGFMSFIAMRRTQKSERLFPTCKLASDGYYSSKWGRWFNEQLLVKAGVKRRKISMHSFRHGFIDATRLIEMPTETSKLLTGHTDGDVHDDYGKVKNLKMLPVFDKWIAKVEYKGLDLTHLPPLK